MAKKFGKFLLFTAAVGTAAAAAYYYMQQKDSQLKESSDADDDYDDFHEDLDIPGGDRADDPGDGTADRGRADRGGLYAPDAD